MTTQLFVPGNVNELVGLSGTVYIADSNGCVQAVPTDVPGFLAAGARLAVSVAGKADFAAPVAAAANNIVSAVTIANNAALTIAAQPGYAGRIKALMTLGSGTITAGNLAITGVTPQGVTLSETLSMIAAASKTLTTTNAYGSILTAAISGLAGTSTGSISLGSGFDLALPLPTGFAGLTEYKEVTDGANNATLGTVDTVSGCVIPNTAPNGTHNYSFYYKYLYPAG